MSTAAVGVDVDGENDRDRDDAALSAHLQVDRIQPDVRPVSLQRALQERDDPLFDLLGRA